MHYSVYAKFNNIKSNENLWIESIRELELVPKTKTKHKYIRYGEHFLIRLRQMYKKWVECVCVFS